MRNVLEAGEFQFHCGYTWPACLAFDLLGLGFYFIILSCEVIMQNSYLLKERSTMPTTDT